MLPDPADIIRSIPGRLCINPTDLATAFPHGGTALGEVTNVEWDPAYRYWTETAEEAGGTVVSAGKVGYDAPALSVVYRGFDPDAFVASFETNAGTRRPIVQATVDSAADYPGAEIDRPTVVLYSPYASQHPGVLLRRALPLPLRVRETGISFGLRGYQGTLCAWVATPDDAGIVWEYGLLEEMTLA